MPKQSTSPVFYATATKATQHGAPVIEQNVPGIAVKTAVPAWDAAVASLKSIAVGEAFTILCKGEVQVPSIAAAVRGDAVYINTTNNALTIASPAAGLGARFGRVVELAGQRGTPTGTMKVDTDLKDTLPAPA